MDRRKGGMNGGTYPGHMKANVAVFVSSQRFLGMGDACLWKALKPEWQCTKGGQMECEINRTGGPHCRKLLR